ncbi:MAG TPA: response regulator transcription factor [Sphingobium sp.]
MRILLVEDDPELAGRIVRGLDRADHGTLHVTSAEQALDAPPPFDAVVLDRSLPGMSGFDLLRRWRAEGNRVPVILLTALDGIEDRVEGLEAGADDHIGKPFAMTELLARLHAIGRRSLVTASAARLEEAGLVLDVLKRELRHHGRLVALQPRELHILEELMRHAGQPVTRAMLLEKIWGFHFEPQTSLVETHISRLRSKLADSGVTASIQTVRNVGYRLVRADT